jgi:hypothetical protein
VNGEAPVLADGANLRFQFAPKGARGLQAIELEWKGATPLRVSAIDVVVVR